MLQRVGRGCVVLSVIWSVGVSPWVRAEDDLPPPPDATEEFPSLDDPSVLDDGSMGADLPPPPDGDESFSDADLPPAPGLDEPELTAEAPTEDPSEVPEEEIPSLEELPPIPEFDTAEAEMPSEGGMVDLPPSQMGASPTRFSSQQELSDLSMDDRLKAKELVLWLSLGPSYGSLQTKGTYTAATTEAVGGVGYTAGIGFMLGSAFQGQFDMVGTPRTRRSTVDHAMFGFGPRLGFISLMGLVGVQQGAILDIEGAPLGRLFSIGAKGGLDIVLSHPKDGRYSIGVAPEAFYMTPQGADGYTNMGVSVSLRIYGYENAF